nr:glycosyltransferase [Halomonas sp. ISL-56]
MASAAPGLRRHGVAVERFTASRSFGASWVHGRSLLRRYTGANLLLCRSLPLGWLRWLKRHRNAFGYITYLIDDDIFAASNDQTLPTAYRKRMGGIARHQSRLVSLVDEVVTASEQLARCFFSEHTNVQVLTPPLIAPLPSLQHFSLPPSSSTNWKIGFYGTRAHLADLVHISPAIQSLQTQRVDTQVEIMLGSYAPESLVVLPRVNAPCPLPWEAFKVYQREHHCHIGLAPLLDTPFNHGKSFIKFFDITAMGGVGIYSNRYPYTEIVRHGKNGLLVNDAPSEWRSALEHLLENPRAAAKMAQQAAVDAKNIGNVETAVQFWLKRSSAVPQ